MGGNDSLDGASAACRILLKLAPRLQIAFLETIGFKKDGNDNHIRIGKTQDLELQMAGSKAPLQHPAESEPACSQT